MNNKFSTQTKAKIDKKFVYAIDNLSLKEEFIKKYLNIYTSRQSNDLYEEKSRTPRERGPNPYIIIQTWMEVKKKIMSIISNYKEIKVNSPKAINSQIEIYECKNKVKYKWEN